MPSRTAPKASRPNPATTATYRKIFYQEKQLGVDPVADDLASLALDVLMGEEGYSRSSGNPLLWQQS